MGLMYFKARRVHVWLDRDDGEDSVWRAENAMRLMRALGHLSCGQSMLGSPVDSQKLYGTESKILGESDEWFAM